MLDIAQPQRVLAAILESSEEASLSVSPNGTILSWSRGAQRLYGYSGSDVLGRSQSCLFPIYELPGLEALLANARTCNPPLDGTSERIRKDGRKICVSVRRQAIRDEQGELILILESCRELPATECSDPLEQQLRSLIEQTPLLVWSTDSELRITSHWGACIPAEEVRAGELQGRPVAELFSADGSAAAPIVQHHKALRGATSRFEYWRENRALDLQLGPLRSSQGEIIGCVGVGVDVTERRRTEEYYRFQATHDHLTGLSNYGVFVETLQRELGRASRACRPFAVLLLDLDGLKTINDTLGHLAGNRALKRLARVMTEHSRSSDLPARYGGDEFGLILIEADPGMADHVAERIQNCLQKQPEQPAITVSIGVANFPADGRTSQELLEAADRRLYQSKQVGRARGTIAS